MRSLSTVDDEWSIKECLFHSISVVAATEHQRLVGLVKPGDVLFDVFAGIGPFAIPAAKKGCTVLANDLNPESYRWLQYNIDLNKVTEQVGFVSSILYLILNQFTASMFSLL